MNLPDFSSKEELFSYLKQNKGLLIMQKKSITKEADSVMNGNSPIIYNKNGNEIEVKSGGGIDIVDPTAPIMGKLVINTTNLMDSHGDVHLPGIWKKNLSDIKSRYLLQEHKMQFDKIISDNVTAYTKTMSWKDLGEPYDGSTQALIFDALIEKDRNPYMHEQYIKGYVKNHSVGMNYVGTFFLCINSKEKYYAEEKTNWEKYIEMVANKQDAQNQGWFWAIPEAKAVEGSAVPSGSNWATPPLSITEAASKSTSEQIEPPIGTHEKKKAYFINLIK